MLKLLLGLVVGIVLGFKYPDFFASQVDRAQAVLGTAGNKMAGAVRLSEGPNAPPIPPVSRGTDPGFVADAEPAPKSPLVLPGYQTPAERKAVERSGWLEIFAEIQKSQEAK